MALCLKNNELLRVALNLQTVRIVGQRGPGRPKGTPNAINSDVRAMILEALSGAGGARYLQRQAIENPGPFMSLLGRILPRDMADEAGGSSVHLHLLAALQVQPLEVALPQDAGSHRQPQRQALTIDGSVPTE